MPKKEMDKITQEDFELDFLSEDEVSSESYYGNYKILIVDDDTEIHSITKLTLQGFRFEDKNLEFLHAYNGKEAIEILNKTSDIAVVFLDVVMEENMSGLKVVEHLRNTLDNRFTRIILRTGQPGEAPEDKIIRDYDINDYRLKTDMTVQRLYTSLYAALRNYRDIILIEKTKKGLEKIINASSSLFVHNDINDFLTSVLNQIVTFQNEDSPIIYLREDSRSDGFVCLDQQNEFKIIAGTGKFSQYIGKSLINVPQLELVNNWIENMKNNPVSIGHLESGFIINQNSKNGIKNFIYIEGSVVKFDISLIKLFLSNYSLALDNFILNRMISKTQTEIIFALGEVIEKHFEDTAGHVRRISEIMYYMGQKFGLSNSECELLRIASTMHDIGKIGIEESILKKRGPLTPEEFDVMKTHVTIGYEILNKSELDIMNASALIALNHHEKWDGSGYPKGLKAYEIPLYARIMAVVDVFDAMTHRRCYKDAFSVKETLEYLVSNKGRHFDPVFVDLLVTNIDEIIEISSRGNCNE